MCATTIAETGMPGVDPRTAGSTCPRSTTATRCRAWSRCWAGLGVRGGRLADRTGARGAQEQPLFPCDPFSEGLPHPSAELRPRARGRGGSGRRAHFRGDPGACDRSRRRAQAHQTPTARVRADHVVLAGNVHLGSAAAAARADGVAGVDLCGGDRAARRPLAEAIAYRGAVSDTELADNHYRIVGGDRLMWSGRLRPRGRRNAARSVAALKRHRWQRLSAARPVEVSHTWAGTSALRTPDAADRRNCRPAYGWQAGSATTASTPPRWPAT